MTMLKMLKIFSAQRMVLGLLSALFLFSVGTPSALASAKEKEEENQLEAPYHLEMKPISVPIRKKSGTIRYYMFLTVSLEFDENDKKSYARKMIPRLRDAFLQDMSGRSVLHKDKRRGMDFDLIKKRLLKQATKVLRKDAPLGVNIVKIFKGS
ncbi:MAG: hypothetical protein JKX94_07480 [Sneathiella sp.]|nr:hypothetical protein [Sneathiella sp.]